MSTNERVRLAQELHDGIAQDLVAIGYSLDNLIAQSPASTRKDLRKLRFDVTGLLERIRREIFNLRSQTPPDFSEVISPSLDFELARIVGELTRNAVKHSHAHNVLVQVSDDGIGGVEEKFGHFGLSGVKERVHTLNGVLLIESTPKGTSVSISVPLAAL